jgi:hypothetical protein
VATQAFGLSRRVSPPCNGLNPIPGIEPEVHRSRRRMRMNGAAGGSQARSPSKRPAKRLVNIVGQQRGHSAQVSVRDQLWNSPVRCFDRCLYSTARWRCAGWGKRAGAKENIGDVAPERVADGLHVSQRDRGDGHRSPLGQRGVEHGVRYRSAHRRHGRGFREGYLVRVAQPPAHHLHHTGHRLR